MKTISKKFTALFLVVVMMLSGLVVFAGLKKEKAYAIPEDFCPMSEIDCVYYFSDSAPSRQEDLDSTIGIYTYYDTHYLITPQEFNFMVYTGYFWDLTQFDDVNLVAIFEFKTMKPDERVLVNLFNLLINNDVKVMLISSYINEYTLDGIVTTTPPYFQSLYANVDLFSHFLRESFKHMIACVLSNDSGGLRDNTALLVDGRYAGIYMPLEEYNLGELCYQSPAFRRIVQYSKFGWEDAAEAIFEETLFVELWELYKVTYFEPLGYNDVPDYFVDLDNPIDDEYTQAWQAVYENGSVNTSLTESIKAYYNEQYEMIFEEYYADLALDLALSNIHILLNVEDDKYVDIVFSSSADLELDNYILLFEFVPGINYIFALAIWPWSTEYSGLLENITNNLPIIQNSYSNVLDEFPIYLWSDEEIPYDPYGLPVYTIDNFYDSETGCIRFPKADEADLSNEFLEKLLALFAA